MIELKLCQWRTGGGAWIGHSLSNREDSQQDIVGDRCTALKMDTRSRGTAANSSIIGQESDSEKGYCSNSSKGSPRTP